jgi:hypothetical protein
VAAARAAQWGALKRAQTTHEAVICVSIDSVKMFRGTIQSDDPTDQNNNTPILVFGYNAEDASSVAAAAFRRYRVIVDDEPIQTILPSHLSEDFPHDKVPADVEIGRGAYARITQTWGDIVATLPPAESRTRELPGT